jgi:hypothetical protein
MPQIISPIYASDSFVAQKRLEAHRVYNGLRPYKTLTLNSGRKVFWSSTSKTTGLYFTVSPKGSISSLHFYQSLRVPGQPSGFAAEALAFKFESGIHSSGINLDLFYSHLIHNQRIVLTDAEYTPDGRSYWDVQYALAASKPQEFGILVVDCSINHWWLVSPSVFESTHESYWGDSDKFKRYRFGIYLKSHEDHIVNSLGDALKDLK